MTPHDIAATWTWTGDRDLPDWLTNHHWTAGQLVIHTPDGDTRPQAGWWLIGWTDGSVTAATPTVAERVYGPDGIAGRLAAAEQRVQRITELRDRWVTAGPPPLGTSMSRWWDKRLVELGGALRSEEQPGPG